MKPTLYGLGMSTITKVFSSGFFRKLGSPRIHQKLFATKTTTDVEEKLAGEEREVPGNFEKTINNVTLLGRIGSDPQKRGTEKHPAVYFSLATHSHYKYESGEQTQRTEWHRVVVFKPGLRDLVFTYMRKGQRIYVNGRITYGSVTEGTVTKPTASIVADDIIFFYSDET